MTATEIANRALVFSSYKLAPVADIEDRLAAWRQYHKEMAEMLRMAAETIKSLQDECKSLHQQIANLKASNSSDCQ